LSKFYYREISEGQVNPLAVRWAGIALDHCKKDLGLSDGIYIQWCIPATREEYDRQDSRHGRVGYTLREFWGMTIASKLSDNKNRIMLRADIPIDKIAHTVAHECRHLADRDHEGDYSITAHLSASDHSEHPSEIRANAYADRAFPEIRKRVKLIEGVRRITEELEALRDGIA